MGSPSLLTYLLYLRIFLFLKSLLKILTPQVFCRARGVPKKDDFPAVDLAISGFNKTLTVPVEDIQVF